MKTLIFYFAVHVFFTFSLYAQCEYIKIGDIEVPTKMAGEYFANLYTEPDTIPNQIFVDGDWFSRRISRQIGTCCWIGEESGFEIVDKDTTGFLATGTSYFSYIVPREPSASDFAKWFLKTQKQKISTKMK